ncbi:hypothetical protein [Candidatus Nanohalobium constans]|uniref:hypothetical protein n=1 Tax=Candidatus Nanohalobium constans TaxID=2565781 RepID=UPI0012983454|nr:hypothetical protein [Candidatus Nanohalobium constans]
MIINLKTRFKVLKPDPPSADILATKQVKSVDKDLRMNNTAKGKIKDLETNKYFWFLIATAIFTALLWIADPSKILSSLEKANKLYILLAVGAGF